MSADSDQPGNFSAALVLTIELLKRGAPVVDLHEWGLRVRKVGEDWSIGTIPVGAIQDYANRELDAFLSHEENSNESAGGLTEVGPAPESD